MEKGPGNLDSLLEELGCGVFQVFIIGIIFFVGLPICFPFYFMTFGLYNPGWKCLDNETTSANITDKTISFPNSTLDYITDSCDGFDRCSNVAFSPEASTIATEFGLICGRSWVTSLMISLFMAGNVLAFVFVGMVGDKFGRKIPVQVSIFLQVILNLISMFSTTWQMFAAVEFLLGVCVSFGTLFIVISNEFVPRVWRVRVASLPTWTIGIASLAMLAMLFRDWKTLRLVTSIILGIAFLAVFFVPQSPRFLSAKGKKKQFMKVIRKIAKYNKAKMPEEMDIDLMMAEMDNDKRSPPSILSLLRKGYRIKTFVIGFGVFSMNLTYFAITFGVSALPGNIYENMLITTLSELPANLFSAIGGNIAGRRISILLFTTLGSLCFFAVAAFDLLTSGGARTLSTLVSLVLAKIFLNATWYVLATAALELYPTLVRGTIHSYACMMSLMGGVLAPYLIPADPETFHICYMVMGGLIFCVGVFAMLLPETKGKPMPNDWDDFGSNANCVKLNEDKNTVV